MTNKQPKAGPELDAMVAERVMGWVWKDDPLHPEEAPFLVSPDGADCWHRSGIGRLPAYSTDIDAAWGVVEKLGESRGNGQRHYYVEIAHDTRHGDPSIEGYTCTIEVSPYWDNPDAEDSDCREVGAFAPTAPLAICLAALAAVKGNPDA